MIASLIGFLGGLGIFLYGTHLLSNGLQKIGASKMRKYLSAISNTRLKGILSGIIVTFVLQSSTVTNILVVGLVGGAVITLSQAFGIVLGSAIGTTITVQVLTFDVAKYAPLPIFLGAISSIFIRSYIWKSIGQILLSVGFVFFGIGMITTSLSPLGENETIVHILVNLSATPLLLLGLGSVLAALMHSSAAVILISIALVTTDVLTLSSILPLVLGANLGATLPVIASSLASKVEGKKLAFFYFLFKGTGVVIAMCFLLFIDSWVEQLPGGSERQIAHFHTLFNVIIVILFVPLTPWIAKLFERIFPQEKPALDFEVRLDELLLTVPEEALLHCKYEIARLAEMVETEMIKQLKNYINGEDSFEDLHTSEQVIDQSFIKIQHYLLKLGQQDLTNSQSVEEVKLLHILNDIEHIGDMIIHFVVKAEHVNKKQVTLTGKDHDKLIVLLDYIEQSFHASLHAFKKDDSDKATRNIQSQSAINQYERDIKFEHFNSMIQNKAHDPSISGVYLDIINQLLQVYHHSMNISRTVLGLI